jgi:hypothetical protein
MYFARACILAIYADQPAARKCTLTGSACPVCYTPENKMAQARQDPRHGMKRTFANMNNRKRILRLMARGSARGAKERANKQAARLGVNLVLSNAWDHDGEDECVFGNCPLRDNIFQCCPQPNLHGMDEGLTSKTNSGVMEALLVEARATYGFDATKVCPPSPPSTVHNVSLHYKVMIVVMLFTHVRHDH